MVIRIHKRTLAIFFASVLIFCALPYLSEIPIAETSSKATVTDWGLSFREPGKTPITDVSHDYLRQFDAYFIGDESKKEIYLTFDAGYENGFTPEILDVLKKHNAPAAFFLVGNFIDREPELVRRMVAEGHTVGNHTSTHPDMSKIANPESFKAELDALSEKYRNVTGEDMKLFYRPPQGKFSEANLQAAQKLGYKTIFWSLAYADWDNSKQPSRESALKTLCERIHPGAIVLLHSTSETNSKILDELLTKWEDMGYSFKSLDELT
ncbi:MAG: polysaccharide deacetylase family protein [Oscillospiraceae bacterium]|nr:polysaccharide deacetylase family protein [Oscillospiraceae bacterium]